MSKVKTSQHVIFELNANKSRLLQEFIEDYGRAVRFYIDYIWNNAISYKTKIDVRVLDIKNDILDCPAFFPGKVKPVTDLSARVLKSASAHALSLVSGAIEKRKRKLYVLSSFKKEHKRTRKITRLLTKEKLVKPDPEIIYPDIDSLCAKIEKSHVKHFDSVLTLSSLGKKYKKITIPFNQHKHSRKLEANGKLLSGIQISREKIYLRWEMNVLALKEEGAIVGCDTGINAVVTLSDKQQSKPCNHGHTLNTILTKVSRKTKGSNAFHRALNHRDNYINYCVNQLDFTNIKEIRVEMISNFRHGKCVRNFLNYSGEALIREKIFDSAFSRGVRVKKESSAYYSQRCSCCGYVDKRNRKARLFSCKHCSFATDADYNASCNHEKTLPSATFLLFRVDKPKKFFWKEEGFFDLHGLELAVPTTKKEINVVNKS